MAQYATRPDFAEGQLLAAADLTALADNPRAAAQRHNRFVHRWGIVSGLTLLAEKDAGRATVSLQPGMAIDGEGREVLVTQPIPLDPAQLQRAIGGSIAEKQNYPVFVAAKIQPVQGSQAASVGLCAGSTARPKKEEAVQIIFQQAGEELSEQKGSALSADPAPDGGTAPWLIFVGYVTWSIAAQAFADIDAEAAKRYRPAVGINASTIAGDARRMRLQPTASPVMGNKVLEISEDAGGPSLVFGTFTSALDPIDPLISISSQGDLKVKGTIEGATKGDAVLMRSGIASDGMILPLPAGVTAEQVSNGSAQVHVVASPRIDPAGSPSPGSDFAALVQECWVDDNLQLHCRICWLSLPTGGGGGALGATAVSQPGQGNYLISAIVAKA